MKDDGLYRLERACDLLAIAARDLQPFSPLAAETMRVHARDLWDLWKETEARFKQAEITTAT